MTRATTKNETDDGKGGTPPETDDGKGGEVTIDPEALKAAIASVLPDLLDKGGKSAETDDGKDKPPAEPPGGGTLRHQEATVESAVRAEVERITREKAVDERLDAVEKKVVEKPPTKLRRITKALWGGDDT